MAFGRKSDEIARLNEALVAQDENMQAMEIQRDEARVVGRIATRAQEEIESPEFQARVGEEAESAAVMAVVVAEKAQLTEDLTRTLTQDHYDDYAARFRAEQGDNIRQALDRTFASNGTYGRLQKEAEDDVYVNIQAEVLEAARTRITGELTEPNAVAARKQALLEKLEGSDELIEFKEAKEAELQEVWRYEATQEAQAQITQDAQATEADYKAAYIQEYKASPRGQNYAQQVLGQLQEQWKDASSEEIAKAIGDEQLQKLLENLAEKRREITERQLKQIDLLDRFENGGIDLKEIPEDTPVTIYLGEIVPIQKKQIDRFGRETGKILNVRQLQCQRKIELIASANGQFIVATDSLANAKSPYARKQMLHSGTVIAIGRKITENGEPRLDPVIAADVPLYYDEEPINPESFTDGVIKIANIDMEGTLAREVDEILYV